MDYPFAARWRLSRFGSSVRRRRERDSARRQQKASSQQRGADAGKRRYSSHNYYSSPVAARFQSISHGAARTKRFGTRTGMPSSRNELLLPWPSRLRLPLTPPSSTSSITKLSAGSSGRS